MSAKWIYGYVWADRKTGRHLYRHLHRMGKNEAGRGIIPGRVDISKHPKIVEGKTRVGDWRRIREILKKNPLPPTRVARSVYVM